MTCNNDHGMNYRPIVKQHYGRFPQSLMHLRNYVIYHVELADALRSCEQSVN